MGRRPPQTPHCVRWGPSCLRGRLFLTITITFRIGCKGARPVPLTLRQSSPSALALPLAGQRVRAGQEEPGGLARREGRLGAG